MPVIIPDNKVESGFQNFGGKSGGLFLLKQNGFNVPSFFIISYQAVQSFLNNEKTISFAVDDWVTGNAIAEDSLWAVRSSADVEDGTSDSYAGLFCTETNVYPAKMVQSIGKLLSAYKSIQEKNYGSGKTGAFSIIIQKMLNSEVSGVLFSRNPSDKNSKDVIINVIPGLGENLVSGREEGLNGYFRKNKFFWHNAEKTFKGQLFYNELKETLLTGNELIERIKPFQNELITGAKKLEKCLKCPIDIEFSIAERKLYWLQVRPITTIRNNSEKFYYDNSNIGENYPGISLPLTISFVQHTYFEAYRRMASFFGMSQKLIRLNEHLFANMVGGINGALYYNITAWQQLLYQFPFGRKTSKVVPKLLGMDAVEFVKPKHRASILNYIILLKNIFLSFIFLKKYNRNYEKVCEKVLHGNKPKDFENKSHTELVTQYKILENKLATDWLAPLLNGFFAMLFFSLLRKTFNKSRLQEHYPNFVNDILYSQGDIVSVKIVRDYQALIKELRETEELKVFFGANSEAEIYKSISAKFPAFAQKLELYLDKFGVRCDEGELKMETVNYSENPVKFIAMLKSGIHSYPVNKNASTVFDFRKIINQEYRYNPIRKFILLLLIRKTLPLIRNRENYRFTRTQIFAVVRSIFRAIDKKLLADGKIELLGDSLWLEFDEILNPEVADKYWQVIKKRKEDYKEFERVERTNRYEKRGNTFIPVIKTKLQNISEKLKGTGCCSGIVINRVKIVTPENVRTANFHGYILVADYFEPGWINLFSQAAGIISAKGNLLSHTAILCREMGIPSIIGVKGITSVLSDNDLVQMNGSTGEIIIEKHGE